MNNIAKLVISILIPLGIGLSSALFNDTGEGSWFQALEKPSWNPPGWVFGPVWTTLYILMGIALYLVWKSPASSRRRTAIILFSFQMVLNFFWSFIFFKLEEPGWAFVEIVVLWFTILVTIFSFASINKTAAWLLVPYISWVSFASLLNYTIWLLNS